MIADYPGESDRRWVLDATVRGLMRGYDARWNDAQRLIKLVACEKQLDADLVNLDTMRASRTFRTNGIIDKLAHQDGLVIFDHKTTSMSIDDPNDVYWRQLAIEAQPSHYELLCGQNGLPIDRIVWDVIRKPAIRPKKLAKKEQAEVASLHRYCGRKVSDETAKLVVSDPVENGELFELRVAMECTNDPGKYFQRRSCSRTRDELVEYAQELWQIGQEILQAQNNNRWYRNSGACMNYGTPCEFLGLCSGYDTPDSDRWKTEPEEETEDTRQSLSHSRIKTFHTCRRKFYYHYKLGLRRVDEDEREALFFGSLTHAALDAWWLAMHAANHEGESDGYKPTDYAANGVA